MVLVGKLLVLMGIFLVFEISLDISHLIRISIYYGFLHIYEILHAAGLFYLFVCSKKVKKELQEKFRTPKSQKAVMTENERST